METLSIQEIFLNALSNIWSGFAAYTPLLVGAVLVLVVGVLIAIGLQGLVIGMLNALKLNDVLKKLKLQPLFEKSGLSLDVAKLIGWLVKWFFIIVFLITAADILQWNEVTMFLRTILFYIPNVIIAVIILLAGLVVAQAVHSLVLHTVSVSGLSSFSGMLSSIAKWSVVVFSFLAALSQLGIASDLIQILFTGFVLMVAIAGGLAFGLGGKDEAGKILEKMRRNLS